MTFPRRRVLPFAAGLAALLLLPRSALAQAQPRLRVRLLEWNVSDSAWVKQLDATRAVLRHADADLLMFAQVAPAIDAAGVRRVLDGLRGAADTTWFVSLVPAGAAYEHTVIASRDSLRAVPVLATIPLPDNGRHRPVVVDLTF